MTNQLHKLQGHYKAEFDKIRQMMKQNPNLKAKELVKRSGLPAHLHERAIMIIEEEKTNEL